MGEDESRCSLRCDTVEVRAVPGRDRRGEEAWRRAEFGVCVEADADIAYFNLLSRITMTECRKELKSQLEEFKPLPTLADCLHIPPLIDLKEMPLGIYFKKTAILRRMSDVKEKVLLAYQNLKSLVWYLEYKKWNIRDEGHRKIV